MYIFLYGRFVGSTCKLENEECLLAVIPFHSSGMELEIVTNKFYSNLVVDINAYIGESK